MPPKYKSPEHHSPVKKEPNKLSPIKGHTDSKRLSIRGTALPILPPINRNKCECEKELPTMKSNMTVLPPIAGNKEHQRTNSFSDTVISVLHIRKASLNWRGNAKINIQTNIPLPSKEIDRIKSLPVGQRPDVNDRNSQAAIDRHLSLFSAHGLGASFFTRKSYLDRPNGRSLVGNPKGVFVIPSSNADRVLIKTGGDVSKIEKELGIIPGSWANEEIVRITVWHPNKYNLRCVTGNEVGTNELWIPTGVLPGEIPEAIINPIKNGDYIEESLLEALNSAMNRLRY